MFKEELKQLLEFARNTDLQDIFWERKGTVLSFKRSTGKTLPVSASEQESVTPAEAAKPVDPLYIRSTMVGAFFRSDSPDRPPLVVEGTIVASGQPVASVEAMKIRKDVVAPMPCRIVKALVANNHAVEYGQPLFEVEPASDENV